MTEPSSPGGIHRSVPLRASAGVKLADSDDGQLLGPGVPLVLDTLAPGSA